MKNQKKKVTPDHLIHQISKPSMAQQRTNTLFRIIVLPVFIAAGVLLIPLIAMQFSDEVAWDGTDFVVAGILLVGTGSAYAWLSRGVLDLNYRIATGIALGTVLMLIWANLAVGIVGSADNLSNLLFFIVPVIGIVGSVLSQGGPRGMSITLFTMALFQVLVTVFALLVGRTISPEENMGQVMSINIFFIALFMIAGWMYQNRARASTP